MSEQGVSTARFAPEGRRLLRKAAAFGQHWGGLIGFALVIIFFSAARPSVFPTWTNARGILDQSAPLLVLAAGVTVILVMGQFDLSIAATLNLCAAVAVASMTKWDQPVVVAVLLALAVGAGIGLMNGLVVSWLGVPSFIGTLAVGSVAIGLELFVTPTTIFEGVDQAYLDITAKQPLGIPLGFLIALGVSLVLLALLTKTVFGRYATAVGDNPTAAFLSGVRVSRIVMMGFVVVGTTSALAGILLSSQAGAYYQNAGTGLLLPAYAAAFLGQSVGKGNSFNIPGSFVGVLLLGSLTTGLTIMNQPTWVASVIQGAVLVLAIVLSGSVKRRMAT